MPKGKAGYEAGSSKGEAHSNNFGIITFYLHEGVILYLANLLIYFLLDFPSFFPSDAFSSEIH
jgi:hypothetical protein